MKVRFADIKKSLLLLFLVLIGILAHGIGGLMIGNLLSQSAADRWDRSGGSAQVSVFFSDMMSMEADRLTAFGHQLDDKLTMDSLVPVREGARLWADAYSARGSVTLESNLSRIETKAYGVGGDYFLFHPLPLKIGASYLTGSDSMQDRVLLDENAAWRLFGSYDVAGQEIIIGQGDHSHIGMVAGVVESEGGYLNQQAGAESMTVYLSYAMLKEYGWCENIQSYEIVMPNPIPDYAVSTVRETLGVDEDNAEIIENSSRFSMINRLKILREFGTRSMNTRSIIYPYWENTARGSEDILAVLALIETVSFAAALLVVCIAGIRYAKRHPLPVARLRQYVEDRIEEKRRERYYEKHPEERDTI